jgi:hypothetical protein
VLLDLVGAGHPIADTQSGFRVYPRAVMEIALATAPLQRLHVRERDHHRGGASRPPDAGGRDRRVLSGRGAAEPLSAGPDTMKIIAMVATHLLAKGLYPHGLWRSLQRAPVTVLARRNRRSTARADLSGAVVGSEGERRDLRIAQAQRPSSCMRANVTSSSERRASVRARVVAAVSFCSRPPCAPRRSPPSTRASFTAARPTRERAEQRQVGGGRVLQVEHARRATRPPARPARPRPIVLRQQRGEQS